MTTPPYSVHYHCHVCGQMHPVAAPRCLPAGLSEPCTIADLYPGGNMPPAIVDFLTNYLLWCDQANDYIERSDPARLMMRVNIHPKPNRIHVEASVAGESEYEERDGGLGGRTGSSKRTLPA